MAEKNYSYPLDESWGHTELITVMEMWQSVELAYEKGIAREEFIKKYQAFKQIVPSIGEEKRLGRDFEEVSGYSLYHVVKAVKEHENAKIIKMR